MSKIPLTDAEYFAFQMKDFDVLVEVFEVLVVGILLLVWDSLGRV
jgi:hypothetical protein